MSPSARHWWRGPGGRARRTADRTTGELRVREDRIVIRTGAGPLWSAACRSVLVTFEVDDVRNVDHRGWSVLASGPLAPLVADDGVLALPLRAWAPVGRDRFVALTVEELSGRRLVGRR